MKLFIKFSIFELSAISWKLRRNSFMKSRFFSSSFSFHMEKNKSLTSKKDSFISETKVFSEIKDLDFSNLKNQAPRKTQLRVLYPADFLEKHPFFDEQERKPTETKGKAWESFESFMAQSKDVDLTPFLPKVSESELLKSSQNDIEYLSMITGIPPLEIKGFKHKILVVRRVVNQTRKGKIPSMYALVIAGNGNGMIGIGEGKSSQLRSAAEKAYAKAIKNMQYIPRYENRTIYGNVKHKFHAVRLELRSRPSGFGLCANHYVHEICRHVGIKDISAKVRGSYTGMNVVKATFEALKAQVLPENIARARGRKVVDVIQTYYS
ncbi:hypothetical protein PCK2_000785 [Pneumocystis canis]|nr:hypothetical protein PCK2_000785 [Pneumocystis canis]